MIRRILLTVTLLAAHSLAWAQAAGDEVGERLVGDFVENVITLQGRFEQSLIDADGNIVERSSGTLEIERPGRFRWSYSEPYEQWLVADGLNIWSYDVDLLQVTVKPQADAAGISDEQFAEALGGDALDAAAESLMSECIDFFRPGVRENLAKLREKTKAMDAAMMRQLEAAIDDPGLNEAIRQAAGLPSGAAPASSGSTPDP